jgi:hypothetical protein
MGKLTVRPTPAHTAGQAIAGGVPIYFLRGLTIAGVSRENPSRAFAS